MTDSAASPFGFEPLSATPLAGVALDELVAAYNRGFSDYPVAVHATPGWLAENMARCDVLPSASWVARRGGRLAGFALIGVRAGKAGVRSHVYSMAVVPEERGRGIGGELLRLAIAGARDRGSPALTLEVLSNNEGARRLYRRAGFAEHRHLVGFRLDRDDFTHPRSQSAVELRRVDPAGCAALAARSLGTTLPWQLQPESLVKLPASFRVDEIFAAGEARGYVATGWLDDSTVWLYHLAVLPEHRRRHLAHSALAVVLERESPAREIRLLPLIPESLNTLIEFLERCGFRRDELRQIEMRSLV